MSQYQLEVPHNIIWSIVKSAAFKRAQEFVNSDKFKNGETQFWFEKEVFNCKTREHHEFDKNNFVEFLDDMLAWSKYRFIRAIHIDANDERMYHLMIDTWYNFVNP
jgi:hypothetical protein